MIRQADLERGRVLAQLRAELLEEEARVVRLLVEVARARQGLHLALVQGGRR